VRPREGRPRGGRNFLKLTMSETDQSDYREFVRNSAYIDCSRQPLCQKRDNHAEHFLRCCARTRALPASAVSSHHLSVLSYSRSEMSAARSRALANEYHPKLGPLQSVVATRQSGRSRDVVGVARLGSECGRRLGRKKCSDSRDHRDRTTLANKCLHLVNGCEVCSRISL